MKVVFLVSALFFTHGALAGSLECDNRANGIHLSLPDYSNTVDVTINAQKTPYALTSESAQANRYKLPLALFSDTHATLALTVYRTKAAHKLEGLLHFGYKSNSTPSLKLTCNYEVSE